MNRVSTLQEQLRFAHEYFERTMEKVTAEQAHWQPAAQALSIAAQYGHVVVFEDFTIGGMLAGTQPLFATRWAGKTGFSSLPPLPTPATGGIPTWDQWGRALKVDLFVARGYAQAVYEATDSFLAALPETSLDEPLDLSGVGLGQRTVGWLLNGPFLANIHMHCGEISCLKGLQGARGYPG